MYDFSVLITVYFKDSPSAFDQALTSIWYDQELKPKEIVLVCDGPLSESLDAVVNKWSCKSDVLLNVIRLEQNQGLPIALNTGLSACKYNIVARMDSDDISLPQRFSKQISFLRDNPQYSVVGSWIKEFSSLDNLHGPIRKLPVKDRDLSDFAKYRCPLNHMSVIYKKEHVLNCGGYSNLKNSQDFHLWGRMLGAGYNIANLPEVLVLANADYKMYQRRGGLHFIRIEYKIQRDFYRCGFLSFSEAVKSFTLRIPIRLMPGALRSIVYKRLFRSL